MIWNGCIPQIGNILIMEIVNCHLQVIMPYSKKGLEKKYPVIFYITGAAWHKQEMYNDIPKLVELAEKGGWQLYQLRFVSLILQFFQRR